MNKHILITGGAGYIGTAITKRFLDLGHEVTVFDSLITGQRDLVDSRAQFVVGDVCVQKEIDRVFAQNKFHTVIHLAALKSVGDGEESPENFFKVNVGGTSNILSSMKKYEVSQIMFSSTAAVYKENETGLYCEDDETEPQSFYGATKVMCEELINQYLRMGALEQAAVFRYFNLAGDAGVGFVDSYAQNVFPVIARAYQDKKPFLIFGDNYGTVDGTGVRDYIHLLDLVEAHVKALEHNASGIFNLGTEHGTSVHELVGLFDQQLSQPLLIEQVDRRAGDAGQAVAIATKAQRELGWQARSSLEDMVSSTLDVYGIK